MVGKRGAILRGIGLQDGMRKAGFPVKHGVVVSGPNGNQDWWIPAMRRDDDGLHEQITWLVRRSEFDKLLLDTAIERGANFMLGRTVELLVDDAGKPTGDQIEDEISDRVDIQAELTFDCAGMASFLASKGVSGSKYLGSYDKQIAIFLLVADYECDKGDKEACMAAEAAADYFEGKNMDLETPFENHMITAEMTIDLPEYTLDFSGRTLLHLRFLSTGVNGPRPSIFLLGVSIKVSLTATVRRRLMHSARF